MTLCLSHLFYNVVRAVCLCYSDNLESSDLVKKNEIFKKNDAKNFSEKPKTSYYVLAVQLLDVMRISLPLLKQAWCII